MGETVDSLARLRNRLCGSAALRRAAAVIGFPSYLTGGSLRDRLLGLGAADLDLVVDGEPRAAAGALAAEFGGRPFALGRGRNTVWRVVGHRAQFDLWRLDTSLEEDALRRDFSVNAMFWRLPHGPLVDVVDGLSDLRRGVLRSLREANLHRDPLRVLRGIRMLSTHPMFTPDSETQRQLRDAAIGLTRVARERIHHELKLILGGPGVRRAFSEGARLGILPVVVPGWESSDASATTSAMLEGLFRIGQARSALASGARQVRAAALAVPAAGYPEEWNHGAAAAALVACGWSPAAAEKTSRAAFHARAFSASLDSHEATVRDAAVCAGECLASALAWAIAPHMEAGIDRTQQARSLLSWQRVFLRRPALLRGDEIAELLGLHPGPERASAVWRLTRARARGEVRDSVTARRWVLDQLQRR